MRLIQRGKCLFRIRPPGRTVRCFRAIAAAGVLIASIAQTQSRGAIIVDGRSGSTRVKGNVAGGPPGGPFTEFNGYDVSQFAPPGLDSFTLDGSPPSGTTSIPGASAVTNAHLDANITVQGDTLFVSSAGSFSALVSSSRTDTREAGASAFGGTNFSLSFSTDRESDYVITSVLSAGGQLIPNRFARGNSTITLGGSFGQRRALNCDTCDFDNGSSVGTLPPGTHTLRANTFLELHHVDGTSANADYQFTFQLTPVIPTIRWENAVSGVFQTGGNWSTGAPPSGTDNAIIDVPGAYTIDLFGNAEHKRLEATGDGVHVNIDLNGFEYVLDEINIGGLDGDNVSITFDDSSGVVVSAASAAAGDGPAQGAGAGGAAPRLRARLLKARRGGTADVKTKIETNFGVIDNGGRVKVQGEGRWTVGILALGETGAGTLEISSGGSVVSERTVIGEAGQEIIEATVTGEGSTWENQSLVVGERGFGLLTISNKALLTAGSIVIGDAAGSVGVINVSSSASLLQDLSESLTIGSEGLGTLNLSDVGSLVEPGNLVMGRHATGDGNATVGSNTDLEVSGELSVGILGKAQLTVDGVVDRFGGAIGFSKIGPKGKLVVREGQFIESRELTVNGTLEIDPTTGAVSVGQLGPLSLETGALTIGPGGTLKGNGIIGGNVDVLPGGLDEFTGAKVLPSNSQGTLTVDGDYKQTGGLLGIEIAGTAPGQFDVLAVTGNATLGGTLLLDFIDDFAPRQGDVFEFLDIGGALSGAFANVEVRNLLPGFQFDVRSDGGGLTMVALNDGVFVPEPATLTLLMFAAAGWSFRRSRDA